MVKYYPFKDWRVANSYFDKRSNLGYIVVVCIGVDDILGEEYMSFTGKTWKALCTEDLCFHPEDNTFNNSSGKTIESSNTDECIFYIIDQETKEMV